MLCANRTAGSRVAPGARPTGPPGAAAPTHEFTTTTTHAPALSAGVIGPGEESTAAGSGSAAFGGAAVPVATRPALSLQPAIALSARVESADSDDEDPPERVLLRTPGFGGVFSPEDRLAKFPSPETPLSFSRNRPGLGLRESPWRTTPSTPSAPRIPPEGPMVGGLVSPQCELRRARPKRRQTEIPERVARVEEPPRSAPTAEVLAPIATEDVFASEEVIDVDEESDDGFECTGFKLAPVPAAQASTPPLEGMDDSQASPLFGVEEESDDGIAIADPPPAPQLAVPASALALPTPAPTAGISSAESSKAASPAPTPAPATPASLPISVSSGGASLAPHSPASSADSSASSTWSPLPSPVPAPTLWPSPLPPAACNHASPLLATQRALAARLSALQIFGSRDALLSLAEPLVDRMPYPLRGSLEEWAEGHAVLLARLRVAEAAAPAPVSLAGHLASLRRLAGRPWPDRRLYAEQYASARALWQQAAVAPYCLPCLEHCGDAGLQAELRWRDWLRAGLEADFRALAARLPPPDDAVVERVRDWRAERGFAKRALSEEAESVRVRKFEGCERAFLRSGLQVAAAWGGGAPWAMEMVRKRKREGAQAIPAATPAVVAPAAAPRPAAKRAKKPPKRSAHRRQTATAPAPAPRPAPETQGFPNNITAITQQNEQWAIDPALQQVGLPQRVSHQQADQYQQPAQYQQTEHQQDQYQHQHQPPPQLATAPAGQTMTQAPIGAVNSSAIVPPAAGQHALHQHPAPLQYTLVQQPTAYTLPPLTPAGPQTHPVQLPPPTRLLQHHPPQHHPPPPANAEAGPGPSTMAHAQQIDLGLGRPDAAAKRRRISENDAAFVSRALDPQPSYAQPQYAPQVQPEAQLQTQQYQYQYQYQFAPQVDQQPQAQPFQLQPPAQWHPLHAHGELAPLAQPQPHQWAPQPYLAGYPGLTAPGQYAQTQYATPSSQTYPTDSHAPLQAYAAPTSYEVPSHNTPTPNPPQSGYGTPTPKPPMSGYGTPTPNPPLSGYGTSTPNLRAPQSGYSTPTPAPAGHPSAYTPSRAPQQQPTPQIYPSLNATPTSQATSLAPTPTPQTAAPIPVEMPTAQEIDDILAVLEGYTPAPEPAQLEPAPQAPEVPEVPEYADLSQLPDIDFGDDEGSDAASDASSAAESDESAGSLFEEDSEASETSEPSPAAPAQTTPPASTPAAPHEADAPAPERARSPVIVHRVVDGRAVRELRVYLTTGTEREVRIPLSPGLGDAAALRFGRDYAVAGSALSTAPPPVQTTGGKRKRS